MKKTTKFLRETNPVPKEERGLKTKLMMEYESLHSKPIEAMLIAPLTCILNREHKVEFISHDREYIVCNCVRCLYGISEQTAVHWRKRLGISIKRGKRHYAKS